MRFVPPRRLLAWGAASVAGLSGAGFGLVQVNIHEPTLLPSPLRSAAVGVEGSWRFAVASRYLVPLIGRWVFVEKFGRHFVADDAALDDWRRDLHTYSANALLGLIRAEGGMFVKAGQHLCASPVAPPLYVNTLKVLMDNAIVMPLEEVRLVGLFVSRADVDLASIRRTRRFRRTLGGMSSRPLRRLTSSPSRPPPSRRCIVRRSRGPGKRSPSRCSTEMSRGSSTSTWASWRRTSRSSRNSSMDST